MSIVATTPLFNLVYLYSSNYEGLSTANMGEGEGLFDGNDIGASSGTMTTSTPSIEIPHSSYKAQLGAMYDLFCKKTYTGPNREEQIVWVSIDKFMQKYCPEAYI